MCFIFRNLKHHHLDQNKGTKLLLIDNILWIDNQSVEPAKLYDLSLGVGEVFSGPWTAHKLFAETLGEKYQIVKKYGYSRLSFVINYKGDINLMWIYG